MSRYKKMSPAVKRRWVHALRTTRRKQGYGAMHSVHGGNGKHYYCPLGILCETEGLKSKRIGVLFINDYKYYYKGSTQPLGAIPPYAFRKKIGLSLNATSKIVDLNDSQNKSFKEIADWIEKKL